MTEPDPYDLQAILDKGETEKSMMIQEEINAIMFAPYDHGNNKPKAKKKKPKLKQTTLKQAFKNAIPKNFQGFPEKNCIAVMLEGKAELVYCPKRYGKATRQKYGKSEHHPPSYQVCCPDCHLVPCSILEFSDELHEELPSKFDFFCEEVDDNDDNHRTNIIEFMKTAYRACVNQDVGKTYCHQIMPTNHHLPKCAVKFITNMVDDSLSPK
jgi:hypothetical protein